ncbi:hypothetical protein KW782_04915 [Candidatus Parcubacteria bacterium]|nr:hypothetical protein [Candidatus Parcubacteria bacterium]
MKIFRIIMSPSKFTSGSEDVGFVEASRAAEAATLLGYSITRANEETGYYALDSHPRYYLLEVRNKISSKDEFDRMREEFCVRYRITESTHMDYWYA